MVLSKRLKFKATIGCFLEDADHNLYGVTCRHVLQAGDGNFYTGPRLDEIPFGRAIRCYDKRKKVIPDIDLIAIDEAFYSDCSSIYKNRKGKECRCTTYNGSVKYLYDKTVFMCYTEIDSDGNTKQHISNTGKVLSEHVHINVQTTVMNELENKYFVVEGNDKTFADESDSGRIVAIETSEDSIEIIGLITGGNGKLTEDVPQHGVLCLLFSSGLEYLSNVYNKQFFLHKSVYTDHINIKEPGLTVFYKTPEVIKQPDFEISDHLCLLMGIVKQDEKAHQTLSLIITFETEMNGKVFTRTELESRTTKYDNADQNCLYQAMIACQFVYSTELHKAEKHLKDACKMILKKSNYFKLRLLCKVVCYTAWLLLEKNETEKAHSLLVKGTEFMETLKDNTETFPHECLGYMYYDHSRCLRAKRTTDYLQTATDLARKAFKYFCDARETSATNMELVLSASHYALMLLDCGELFERCSTPIGQAIIEEAEATLEQVEEVRKNEPSVEEVYFHMAEGDLAYRQHKYNGAFESWKHGRRFAEEMHIQKEFDIFDARIEGLRRHLFAECGKMTN